LLHYLPLPTQPRCGEREEERKCLLLPDLRESGSLEQDADCIVFLWRGEYYNIAEYKDGTATTDTILFDITKNRNGATDEVIVACNLRRELINDIGRGHNFA
jgi:replicative DNA helicase